ncbi:MAG: M15 family metallopeptidase [Candidatus Limnocylindrales bacterium]
MLNPQPTNEGSRGPGLSLIVPILAIAAATLLVGAGQISATAPPTGLPDCSAAERPAAYSGYDEWDRTMLDPGLTLDRSYEPPDLTEAVIRGQRVTLRSFVLAPLRAMLDTAASEEAVVSITSGYRSFTDQKHLLAASPGLDDAIARPGHSEHQLGTAVDLAGDRAWLRVNASRFGFVLSYPATRSPQFTCYRAEPWHFRYFGPQRARAIEESGLSPREWLWAEATGRR